MRYWFIRTAILRVASIVPCAFVLIALLGATPAQASELCEVLNRFNADKKTDSKIRERFEGEYGAADDADRLRTWNVQTICEDFLVAVPLWADVSPMLLVQEGDTLFKNETGLVLDFLLGDDGSATGAKLTMPDGTVSEVERLGNPRSFD